QADCGTCQFLYGQGRAGDGQVKPLSLVVGADGDDRDVLRPPQPETVEAVYHQGQGPLVVDDQAAQTRDLGHQVVDGAHHVARLPVARCPGPAGPRLAQCGHRRVSGVDGVGEVSPEGGGGLAHVPDGAVPELEQVLGAQTAG